MRTVRISEYGRTVLVDGGATWADVDRVTQPFGLATPGGVVSETGVAGLALSGGVSWQRNLHGMTIDNLVSAELVLADGRQVRASAREHPDLYWAIRGGGGNFGIVTRFEFRLHRLGPEVFELNVAYPIEDAARVLAGWRDFAADAPDELSTVGYIWSLPVIPELPEQLRGLPFVGVGGMYAGDLEEGERVTRALRELATPLLDMSRTTTYLELQGSLDAYFPAGLRYYWKALYLDGLPDDAVEQTVAFGESRPSPRTLIVIRHCAGAMARVGRRGHGVRRSQLGVHAEHRRDLGRPRRRRASTSTGRARTGATPTASRSRGRSTSTSRACSRRAIRPCARATAPITSGSRASRPSTTRRTSSGSTRTSARRSRGRHDRLAVAPSPLWRLAASRGAPQLAAAGLLGRIAMGMIPLALILAVAAHAGSYGAAGAITAAYALGVALGGPLRGRLADRLGARPGAARDRLAPRGRARRLRRC